MNEERLNPEALLAAYEAQHAHNSDPGRKGSGLEHGIRAYLSALRAADHPAVVVRELTWVKSNAGERWTAQYAFGQFEITRAIYATHTGPAYTWQRGICSEHFETLEQAQAAAQADYERRLLSCIEPLRPATEQAGGEVEPDYWAVHSLTGSHIGLWKDETYARNVLKEYEGGTITALYTSPAATQSAVVSEAPTHRHVKRGSEYVLMGIGRMQTAEWRVRRSGPDRGDQPRVDMREVAIYRSVADGSLWVRPREEFEDGRFAALSNPGASQ